MSVENINGNLMVIGSRVRWNQKLIIFGTCYGDYFSATFLDCRNRREQHDPKLAFEITNLLYFLERPSFFQNIIVRDSVLLRRPSHTKSRSLWRIIHYTSSPPAFLSKRITIDRFSPDKIRSEPIDNSPSPAHTQEITNHEAKR